MALDDHGQGEAPQRAKPGPVRTVDGGGGYLQRTKLKTARTNHKYPPLSGQRYFQFLSRRTQSFLRNREYCAFHSSLIPSGSLHCSYPVLAPQPSIECLVVTAPEEPHPESLGKAELPRDPGLLNWRQLVATLGAWACSIWEESLVNGGQRDRLPWQLSFAHQNLLPPLL